MKNRIGEINYNTFGSEMIITKYRKYSDVDIYFPEYNWTFKNARYGDFKNGNVRCPYEPRVLNKGYLGEGEYKVRENNKNTKVYNTWHNMLMRCYSDKYHDEKNTYIYCEAEEYLLNFQNFGKWYSENYYEVEGEQMHLDKDILCKGNKIYNRENMIFVPERINTLFIKSDKIRGHCPIGVHYHKQSDKYTCSCKKYDFVNKRQIDKYLGIYDTEVEAFEVYKYYKEQNIKEVADYYKGRIPDKLYQAMYNYEVEIND